MLKRSLQCLAGLSLLATLAGAQPASFGNGSSRPIRLMLGGGVTVPVSDFADFYESGFNVTGGLLISFPDGGAGIQVRLFGIDAFVEGRINNVYTDKGVIDRRSIQMVPVTFGLIF